jgi:hypothetical protein
MVTSCCRTTGKSLSRSTRYYIAKECKIVQKLLIVTLLLPITITPCFRHLQARDCSVKVGGKQAGRAQCDLFWCWATRAVQSIIFCSPTPQDKNRETMTKTSFTTGRNSLSLTSNNTSANHGLIEPTRPKQGQLADNPSS